MTANSIAIFWLSEANRDVSMWLLKAHRVLTSLYQAFSPQFPAYVT